MLHKKPEYGSVTYDEGTHVLPDMSALVFGTACPQAGTYISGKALLPALQLLHLAKKLRIKS